MEGHSTRCRRPQLERGRDNTWKSFGGGGAIKQNFLLWSRKEKLEDDIVERQANKARPKGQLTEKMTVLGGTNQGL